MKKVITIRPSTVVDGNWYVLGGGTQQCVTRRELIEFDAQLHHLARAFVQRRMPCNARAVITVILNKKGA